jgi:hypothetical protein
MNIPQKELITNDKLYEQKYLIYKYKYLKIKNQIGGIFKVGDEVGPNEDYLMRKFIEVLELKCLQLQRVCESFSKTELFLMIITLSKSSKVEDLKEGEFTMSLKNFMIYNQMLDFSKKILDKISIKEKLIYNEEYFLEYISMIKELENMGNMTTDILKYPINREYYLDLSELIEEHFEAYDAFMSYSEWIWRISPRHPFKHNGSPSKLYREMTEDEKAEYEVKEKNKNKRIQELLIQDSEISKQYNIILSEIKNMIDKCKSLEYKDTNTISLYAQIFFSSNFDSEKFNEIKSVYDPLSIDFQDLKTKINCFNAQWKPVGKQMTNEFKTLDRDPILKKWRKAQDNGRYFYGKGTLV